MGWARGKWGFCCVCFGISERLKNFMSTSANRLDFFRIPAFYFYSCPEVHVPQPWMLFQWSLIVSPYFPCEMCIAVVLGLSCGPMCAPFGPVVLNSAPSVGSLRDTTGEATSTYISLPSWAIEKTPWSSAMNPPRWKAHLVNVCYIWAISGVRRWTKTIYIYIYVYIFIWI